jgi:hypothetical protein
MNRNLKIICIYRADTGREIGFNHIPKNDTVEQEDYDLNKFWNTMGGFSVTKDGYYNIFYSTNFYVGIQSITFLLQSLYWIKGEFCDWFDYENPNSITLKTMNNEIVELSNYDNENIQMSYLRTNESRINRDNNYFESEIFNKNVWFEETMTALDEYFLFFIELLQNTKIDDETEKMREFYDIWLKIKNNNLQN